MKLLIISQYFWPEDVRISDLAAGFQQRGHEVTVLTGIPNYPVGRFFNGYGYFKNLRQHYEGVRVIRVPLIARGRGSAFRMACNYLSFALFSCVLAPFYCRGKYDAIFVFGASPVTVALPAILIRWLKRIPMIYWVLDLWPESLSATGVVKSRWVLDQVGKLVRFIYRRCDLVLVQSRSFIRSVQEAGAAPESVRYFPSWAEALYRPVEPRLEDVPQMPPGFRVMFAGNIGEAQDMGSVLAAAELLKDEPIQWVIVGEGRMHGWARQQAEARGLSHRMHFLGRHPMEKMPQFFAHADVMLVSLRRAAIFSMTIPGKIQSYLACGKPIVAMLDGEGARVVEEAGAGLVCAAENAQELAAIVRAMYKKTATEREKMGSDGLQYYKSNFEREMLFDRVESWMEELNKAK